MDDVSWAALTITLTVVGALLTWVAYRRRGVASGLKVAGISTLPLAAYLTDTLQMFTRIVDAVVSWATRLAFSPSVWAGVVVAGLGVVLFLVGQGLQARGRGTTPRPAGSSTASGEAGRGARETGPAEVRAGRKPRSEPVVDDDLADIEAILKKRGIS